MQQFIEFRQEKFEVPAEPFGVVLNIRPDTLRGCGLSEPDLDLVTRWVVEKVPLTVLGRKQIETAGRHIRLLVGENGQPMMAVAATVCQRL